MYDKNMNRFVNELLPRDLLTEAIYEQMEKDHTEHVWEDLRTIPEEELRTHFPNIVEHCRQMGYDVTRNVFRWFRHNTTLWEVCGLTI